MGNNYSLTESAECWWLLCAMSLSSPTLCAQTLYGRIVLLFSTCGIKNQEKIHRIWNNYFTDCMTSCPDNGTKNARKMPELKKKKICWFHYVVTSSLHWSDLQPNVTSKSEALVLSRKKLECVFQIRDKVLLQVEEQKYFRVLFTSEGSGKQLQLCRCCTGLMQRRES